MIDCGIFGRGSPFRGGFLGKWCFLFFDRISKESLENRVFGLILFELWCHLVDVGLILLLLELVGFRCNSAMGRFRLDLLPRHWFFLYALILLDINSALLQTLHILFELDGFCLERVGHRNRSLGVDWGFLDFWLVFSDWAGGRAQVLGVVWQRSFAIFVLGLLGLSDRFEFACFRIGGVSEFMALDMLVEFGVDGGVFGNSGRNWWLVCAGLANWAGTLDGFVILMDLYSFR